MLTLNNSLVTSVVSISDLKHECLLVLNTRSIEKKLNAFRFSQRDKTATVADRLLGAIDQLSCVRAIHTLPSELMAIVVEAVKSGFDKVNATVVKHGIARNRVPLLFALRMRLAGLGKWLNASYVTDLVNVACSGTSLCAFLADLTRFLPTISRHLVALGKRRGR